MHTTMTIIYGVPITEKIRKMWGEDELIDLGFKMLYSGDEPGPIGYFGVELDSFESTSDPIALSKLKLFPTKDQIKTMADLMCLSVPASRLGKPGVYILCSLSMNENWR